MKTDPAELGNETLAKLLDDEARFRPVYNGDMAPVMREAARRLRERFFDVPAGWQLVPRRITPEMERAAMAPEETEASQGAGQ